MTNHANQAQKFHKREFFKFVLERIIDFFFHITQQQFLSQIKLLLTRTDLLVQLLNLVIAKLQFYPPKKTHHPLHPYRPTARPLPAL